jgi:hypothetical protein
MRIVKNTLVNRIDPRPSNPSEVIVTFEDGSTLMLDRIYSIPEGQRVRVVMEFTDLSVPTGAAGESK